MHSSTFHPVRPQSLPVVHCIVLVAAVLALAGCKQSGRDPTDVTPSSTARANTTGGGSTSDGKVSGKTPVGQDLPQRETSTRTGPGTSNPVHGGGEAAGASGSGGANAGTGTGTSTSTGADMSGGSGSPSPVGSAGAVGSAHVTASGATSASSGGVANAPGMAAGPNGRRSASEGTTMPQR